MSRNKNHVFQLLLAGDNFTKVILSQRMRQGGNIACGRAMKTAHNAVIGKPEKQRSSGRQVYYNEPSGCMRCALNLTHSDTCSCEHKNPLFGPIQE
jgi:hypothetical protein